MSVCARARVCEAASKTQRGVVCSSLATSGTWVSLPRSTVGIMYTRRGVSACPAGVTFVKLLSNGMAGFVADR